MLRYTSIGARLNDKNAGYDDPNMIGIMQELGARDEENKSTDVFGVFLNPFNDGINEFAFLVTAAGTNRLQKYINDIRIPKRY